MNEPKLTIGEFDITLYALIRDMMLAGVRKEDIQASIETAVECAEWFVGRDNVLEITSQRSRKPCMP